MLRHGALNSATQSLVLLGASNDDLYKAAMNEIKSLRSTLEGASGRADRADRPEGPREEEDVKDPVVVKTKGAPRSRSVGGRKRKCTRCKKTGHTKRRCTQEKMAARQEEDKESSASKGEPFLGTQQSRTTDKGIAMKSISDRSCEVLQLLKALQMRLLRKRVSSENEK
ncbi:hypothetical protein PIB30_037464 [Stylosanthes scabra]|uniref:CCHC-type domain-containing protein n=1 Tax=Stylosanthes scabra TaxID=79078 RepID=A0ABU6UD29_9FABA|nr:hypothetical protein [Stylosanthes scabra]